MANSYLPFQNPDTTDHKLDTEELTVGANTVHRERVQIAGAAAAEVAEVDSSDPAGTEQGLIVRDPNAVDIVTAVEAIQAAVEIMDDWDSSDAAKVVGNVAHNGVDSGNPLKIGGRAQAPTAALEEVADNDRVDAAFDRQGRLAIWNGYPVQSVAVNTASSGDNTLVAAQGAGKRIAVIGGFLQSDGTVDVRLEDGAAGTAKTGQQPLQAREGFVLPIGNAPWFVGSANTLLNLELSAAINVHGIISYIVMED